MEKTVLRAARTHNLRSVNLTLEPGTFVVLAGVSGSGKSSLAIDTLYAEGQRRFVESFSAYARQFLERRDRPPVDSLDPVPAAIAVDRGAMVRTSRSTVGTMTELQDYLRLLWASVSTVVCPTCNQPAVRETVRTITDGLLTEKSLLNKRVVVTHVLPVADAEAWLGIREHLLKQGYRRLWIGDEQREIDTVRPTETTPSVEVIIDRFVLKSAERTRVTEALSAAMNQARLGWIRVEGQAPRKWAKGLWCHTCNREFKEPTAAFFSFQSPVGACGACRGFGRTIELDWERVIPNPSLSLQQGALKAWSGVKATWERDQLLKVCKAEGISMTVPWSSLTEPQQKIVKFGKGKFLGVKGWFDWLEERTYKMHVRVFLSRFRKYETCAVCAGSRLRAEVSQYRVEGMSLADAGKVSVSKLRANLKPIRCGDDGTQRVLNECLARLGYLEDVGLGYLTLERSSRTLSGGEVQRVSLTAALGTALTGTLMVLDEPTVGLHPRDASRLVGIAKSLAQLGNTALVVEHDPTVIASADRVIEMGPGAGILGGQIVFDGTPKELQKQHTPTALALKSVGRATHARRTPTQWLTLHGAKGHNLRGISVRFPLGVFTCVTGVSGSGKSSLVSETLAPAVARMLGTDWNEAPLPFSGLDGVQSLRSMTYVDQSPLSRTSRGNIATFSGAWDSIRQQFASLPEAVQRGYTASIFSFNVDGGRCPSCKGEGFETVEMQFLADVSFRCPDCKGKRFRDEVLELRLDGSTISDVLEMNALQVCAKFSKLEAVQRALKTVIDVGIGYVPLGQPLSMLSGGEAQRLKLARALTETGPGSLVILDEPTAGLHPQDLGPILNTIEAMVERNVTVIAVEHDPLVISQADWVIDIGPEAAEEGGMVLCEGTPEQVAAHPESRIAPYLREALAHHPALSVSDHQSRRSATSAELHSIVIEGAREHNLHVDYLEIPRGKLVAFTGASGSGKSSLAFDVVYAEGQRRFLETLSPYARQYLPSLGRANVERVIGIPPAISLEQRTARAGAMSTVATVTEVAHYLRLLFARVGTAYCPHCDLPITAQTEQVLLDQLIAQGKKNVRLWAPIVKERKTERGAIVSRAKALGITELRVDGTVCSVDSVPAMAKSKIHSVAFLLGEFALTDPGALDRMQRATALGQGELMLELLGKGKSVSEELRLHTRRTCPKCHRGVPELDPRHFSFNTPQGRCEKCEGSGVDDSEKTCKSCGGTRLCAIARSVRLNTHRYPELAAKTAPELREAVKELRLSEREQLISRAPISELESRLRTIDELGLGYLTLDRQASTLSGGEMQRLRLAAQIGAGLTGVLYVLDEPTIGLHGSDTHRLLRAMRRLVDRGASVFVVEHDTAVIRAADWMIDLGPGGGTNGGRVVAAGPTQTVLKDERSPTAVAMQHEKSVVSSTRLVSSSDPKIVLTDVTAHNLRGIQAEFPVGRLVAVAGVSGSGKSTLVNKVLFPAVCRELGLKDDEPLAFGSIANVKAHLRTAKRIDQTPLGRTPRSVPATYVGFWDELRKLFANTTTARTRGWTASRFSFNTSTEKGGGRCDECEGAGVKNVEMSFLPDVNVPCEVCGGLRFSRETCEVQLHGMDAGSVLQLTVSDARTVFAQVESILRPLDVLAELGLGYLTLGQGSHTLSGGEAQRVKLASELQSRGGKTLYVLDEPTTGLHLSDVNRLMGVLQKLVARGDSVVLVEHHPSVLAAADWIIELGPGGGKLGGKLLAAAPPSQIAKLATPTGKVLRELRESQ